MSTDSNSYSTHVPDPLSRFRWVPPLGLGIALGGMIGCLATFAVLELGKRLQVTELAAQQFNTANVLNAVPGTSDVTFSDDTTNHLGRVDDRKGYGSAIHRRMQIQGWLPKGTNAGTFAQQFAAQVEAELDRLGTTQRGGSTLSSSGDDSAKQVREVNYYTRDGRHGYLRLDLKVWSSHVVEGTLVITEGR